MKKWIGLAFAAVLLIGAVYFGSPYWAARSLKEAALAADADKLDTSVDFPAVRESLKAQISAAMIRKMNSDPDLKGNPFAGIGLLMMPTIVDRLVDTFVTSDGLSALIRGNKPAEGADVERTENPDIDYDYQWVSADRFRVRLSKKSTGEQGPAFVLDRRGFVSWKLVKLELPESLFKN